MLEFEDKGIIFYSKKHKERSLILKIFSEKHGVVIGYLTNGINKYNFYKNQIGNYISFSYSQKNENLLGFLNTEIIYSNGDLFFSNKTNIILFNSAIFYINFFVKEKLNEENLYKIFKNFVFSIKNDSDSILLFFMDFLFSIIDYLGINLNFDVCYVSGKTDNVYYISPKTGNSVSREVGEKYKNKLFIIPKCFKNYFYEKKDILNAFEVIYYFLEKFIDENNLFYLKKDFLFLKKELFFVLNNLKL